MGRFDENQLNFKGRFQFHTTQTFKNSTGPQRAGTNLIVFVPESYVHCARRDGGRFLYFGHQGPEITGNFRLGTKIYDFLENCN